ncbi:GAF domain-containing protein [Paenibacillus montanisoli]|uniref:GAF domain-containing protein n=1 Tax=Paenibacillus montanisoli TaxID=2081970 RepID=A0A328U206_9BACL|nr:GAF domain-containing protein [Paenibacillus montanisoli]RAP75803.1 hypothetical protein DL346_10185 [Paenibacillus montanisoli]
MEGYESISPVSVRLHELREAIGSDFCSLGVLQGEERLLYWISASGNRSDRFRQILELPAKGLSGTVLKVGRAMTFQAESLLTSRQLQDYPIMLAEGLQSVIAVPLLEGSYTTGVLLTGDRKPRIYSLNEKACLQEASKVIANLLYEQRTTLTGGEQV